MTADLPVTISYGDFAAALQSLGISASYLESLTYRPGCLTVQHVRIDGSGRTIVAGDVLATVTTDINVDRSGRSRVGTEGGVR